MTALARTDRTLYARWLRAIPNYLVVTKHGMRTTPAAARIEGVNGLVLTMATEGDAWLITHDSSRKRLMIDFTTVDEAIAFALDANGWCDWRKSEDQLRQRARRIGSGISRWLARERKSLPPNNQKRNLSNA